MSSMHSPLARLSELFSGTGSAKRTAKSNTTADSWTESTKCGPTLSPAGAEKFCSALATLPETRRLVVTAALNELFTKKYFNICQLSAVLEVTNGSENTDAYRLLRTLHCVDYAAMSPELRNTIPQLVNECLAPPPKHCLATDIALQGVTL